MGACNTTTKEDNIVRVNTNGDLLDTEGNIIQKHQYHHRHQGEVDNLCCYFVADTVRPVTGITI